MAAALLANMVAPYFGGGWGAFSDLMRQIIHVFDHDHTGEHWVDEVAPFFSRHRCATMLRFPWDANTGSSSGSNEMRCRWMAEMVAVIKVGSLFFVCF